MPQQTLIFLGPQGCGKGTQIELIKKLIAERDPSHGIAHFEMGKNLRELATHGDFTGRHTQEILLAGELIPYAVSATVFVRYLMDHLTINDEHIIIDGFPRTAIQVPMLDSALVEFYRRANIAVVVINISDDEAVKRLKLRGRSDDTEGSIRKRLEWSRLETMPNVEWFKKSPNYKVVEIDGEHTVEEVHALVRHALTL